MTSITETAPRNLALMLAALTMLGPFAIDTYLPAQPAIAAALETDIHRVEQTMGIYMAGLAAGPLLGGPLSDRYGRRLVAVIGLLFFAVASFLIALCTSIDQMLVLRFLQALGGGFATVTAAATVRDFYTGREAAKVMALIGIIMMIAPLAAPAIGALLLEWIGWRAVFWWLGGYSLLVAIVLGLKMPQAQRVIEKGRGLMGVLHSYGQVLSHRQTMVFAFTQAFAGCTMFMFLTESAYVYIGYYGIGESTFPLLFGANIITMALFNRINARQLSYREPEQLLRLGIVLQTVAALLLLAVVALTSAPLWLVVILIMFAVGSMGFIFSNSVTCALAAFPASSGAANAIVGTLGFAMAGVLTLLLTLLHDGSPLPMAAMMALCAVLSMLVLFGWSRHEDDHSQASGTDK
ncbi:MAG: multidrug effflux MFS transporter [Marinobacterium sp.]|nr:multidrug effflux MFS transporter [Marinobacterium sp.]